jgi:RNA-directed DNA polymerase
MAQEFRIVARFTTVKAVVTMRINLVVPLAHEATAMRIADTTGSDRVRSGAVSPMIGASLRRAT